MTIEEKLTRAAWEYQDSHGFTDEDMANALGFGAWWEYANLRTASNAEPWTIARVEALAALLRVEVAALL